MNFDRFNESIISLCSNYITCCRSWRRTAFSAPYISLSKVLQCSSSMMIFKNMTPFCLLFQSGVCLEDQRNLSHRPIRFTSRPYCRCFGVITVTVSPCSPQGLHSRTISSNLILTFCASTFDCSEWLTKKFVHQNWSACLCWGCAPTFLMSSQSKCASQRGP